MAKYKIRTFKWIRNIEDFDIINLPTLFKNHFPVLEVTEYIKSFVNKEGQVNLTVENYLSSLKRFYEWLDTQGINFEDISVLILKRYLNHLHKLGLKKTTKYAYYAIVVRFVEWNTGVAEQERIFGKSSRKSNRFGGILKGIKGPKELSALKDTLPNTEKNKPDFLYAGDVEKIRKWIINTFEDELDFPYQTLYKTIYEILINTGVRKGELLSLRIDCLSRRKIQKPDGSEVLTYFLKIEEQKEFTYEEARKLGLFLKTGEREIPITNKLAKLILEWKALRPIEAEYDFLLCNIHPDRYGKVFSQYALKHFFSLMNNAEYGAKTEKRTYPHIMRHTFATELAKDLPLDVVQRLLGHASVETTTVYVHLDGSRIVNELEGIWETNSIFKGEI